MSLEERLGLDIAPALQSVDDLGARIEAMAAQAAAELAAQLAAATSSVGSIEIPPVDIPEIPPVEITTDIGSTVEQIDSVTEAQAKVEPNVTTSVEVDGADTAVDQLGAVADAQNRIDTSTTSAPTESPGGGGAGPSAPSALIDVAAAKNVAGDAAGELGVLNGTLTKSVTGLAGLAAGLGFATKAAIDASTSTVVAENAFGGLADQLEVVNQKGLAAKSLSELAIQLGSDDDSIRIVASRYGALAQQVGFTREESVKLSQDYITAASAIVAKNPSLGTVDQVLAKLQTSLARGGRFTQQLGIDVGNAADITERAAVKFGKPADQLSITEKAAASLDVALDHLGGKNIGFEIQKGSESPELQLRSIRTALEELVESIGQPFIAPVLDVLKKLEPIIVKVAKAGGELAAEILPPLLSVLGLVADALNAIPSSAIVAAGAFFAATKIVGALSTALVGLSTRAAIAAESVGAASLAAKFDGFASGAATLAGPVAAAAAAAAVGFVIVKNRLDELNAEVERAEQANRSYAESLDLTGKALAALDPAKATEAFAASSQFADAAKESLGPDAFAVLQKAGVGFDDLSKAANGSQEAMLDIQKRLQAIGETGDSIPEGLLAGLLRGVPGGGPALGDALAEVTGYGDGLSEAQRQLNDFLETQQKASKAAVDSARAQLESGKVTDEAAIKTALATGAANAFTDAQRAQLGVLLDAAQKKRDDAQAAAELAAQLDALDPAMKSFLDTVQGALGANAITQLRDLARDPNFAKLPQDLQDQVTALLALADTAREAAKSQGLLIDANGELTTSLVEAQGALDSAIGKLRDLQSAGSAVSDGLATGRSDILSLADAVDKYGTSMLDANVSSGNLAKFFGEGTAEVKKLRDELSGAKIRDEIRKLQAEITESSKKAARDRLAELRKNYEDVAKLPVEAQAKAAENLDRALREQERLQRAPKPGGGTDEQKARLAELQQQYADTAKTPGEVNEILVRKAKQNALALRSELVKSLEDAKQYGRDVLAQTGSTEQAKAATKSQVDALREQAKQLGINSAEFDLLAAQQRALPEQLNTDFTTSGVEKAATDLQGVQDIIDGLPPDVKIQVLLEGDAAKQLEIINAYLDLIAGKTAPETPPAGDTGKQQPPGYLTPGGLDYRYRRTAPPPEFPKTQPTNAKGFPGFPFDGMRYSDRGVEYIFDGKKNQWVRKFARGGLNEPRKKNPNGGLYAPGANEALFAEAGTAGEWLIPRDPTQANRVREELLPRAAADFGLDVVSRDRLPNLAAITPTPSIDTAALASEVGSLRSGLDDVVSAVRASGGGSAPLMGSVTINGDVTRPSKVTGSLVDAVRAADRLTRGTRGR